MKFSSRLNFNLVFIIEILSIENRRLISKDNNILKHFCYQKIDVEFDKKYYFYRIMYHFITALFIGQIVYGLRIHSHNFSIRSKENEVKEFSTYVAGSV